MPSKLTSRLLSIPRRIGWNLVAASLALAGPAWTQSHEAGSASRGEFGGDLAWLEEHHTGPQACGESNHYLDLWTGSKVRDLATLTGLTNNHALIVNSHGQARATRTGLRFAFYPHRDLLNPGQPAPQFSAADLARVIGPAADNIHNILIAGCNADGAFRADELRRHFVNATNITHAVAGQLGYQPMFLQTLASPSAEIRPLYQTKRKGGHGGVEYFMGTEPIRGATELRPYLAELFTPGALKPFRTQVAGRELLDPPPRP